MLNNEQRDKGSACDCGGGSCCSGPGKWIWIAMAVAVAGVMIARNAGKNPAAAATPAAVEASAAPTTASERALQGKALPRLVDLGAHSCIPCRMMAPILEELKRDYAEAFGTEFIDVWADPDAGKKHGISLIPTQIFYDAAGKELFRHEGFFGKDDILANWQELGVELEKNSAVSNQNSE